MPNPTIIWRVGALVAFILFFIWAKMPKLPYRGFAASVGGIVCFIALAALTEIVRRHYGAAPMPAVIAIYVIGIGFSIVAAGFYAFFFTFLYVKNF